jgi:hypothetical protein
LEKLVLFIPNLESQFYNKKEFQESITPLSCPFSTSASHVNYESVERKLYFRSIALGTMEFQLVLLDFKRSKITFIRKMDSARDLNQSLYEWLSSLQFNFEPKKMSFVLERPEENYTK